MGLELPRAQRPHLRDAPTGKPGIWFFSLDCESPGAVEVARRTYRLPYFRARMSSQRDGDEIEYSSARCEPGSGGVVFHARYAPDGDVFDARRGRSSRS